jgi:ubiquinone/menaquinone biosynthesis C-methylase UbiE
MSRTERWACTSAPWRAFAGRVVLPWVVGDAPVHGDVLEIGGGSGSMAAAVAERHPDVRVISTDLDPEMVASASRRLAPYGGRATAQVADATQLPFEDRSFDLVLSFLMFHHIVGW